MLQEEDPIESAEWESRKARIEPAPEPAHPRDVPGDPVMVTLHGGPDAAHLNEIKALKARITVLEWDLGAMRAQRDVLRDLLRERNQRPGAGS